MKVAIAVDTIQRFLSKYNENITPKIIEDIYTDSGAMDKAKKTLAEQERPAQVDLLQECLGHYKKNLRSKNDEIILTSIFIYIKSDDEQRREMEVFFSQSEKKFKDLTDMTFTEFKERLTSREELIKMAGWLEQLHQNLSLTESAEKLVAWQASKVIHPDHKSEFDGMIERANQTLGLLNQFNQLISLYMSALVDPHCAPPIKEQRFSDIVAAKENFDDYVKSLGLDPGREEPNFQAQFADIEKVKELSETRPEVLNILLNIIQNKDQSESRVSDYANLLEKKSSLEEISSAYKQLTELMPFCLLPNETDEQFLKRLPQELAKAFGVDETALSLIIKACDSSAFIEIARALRSRYTPDNVGHGNSIISQKFKEALDHVVADLLNNFHSEKLTLSDLEEDINEHHLQWSEVLKDTGRGIQKGVFLNKGLENLCNNLQNKIEAAELDTFPSILEELNAIRGKYNNFAERIDQIKQGAIDKMVQKIGDNFDNCQSISDLITANESVNFISRDYAGAITTLTGSYTSKEQELNELGNKIIEFRVKARLLDSKGTGFLFRKSPVGIAELNKLLEPINEQSIQAKDLAKLMRDMNNIATKRLDVKSWLPCFHKPILRDREVHELYRKIQNEFSGKKQDANNLPEDGHQVSPSLNS